MNQYISQHQELSGFSVKYNTTDDAYEVTVPNTVTGATDNEQKSLYSTIAEVIQSKDPDAYTIDFVDQGNMPVAHVGAFSGTIKLDR